MDLAFNPNAAKKPINLSVNSDVVARARALTDNLSSEVERLLIGFINEKLRQETTRVQALKRAAEGWNEFIDRNGSFADEFSTL